MPKTSLFIYDVSDNLPEVCTVGGKNDGFEMPEMRKRRCVPEKRRKLPVRCVRASVHAAAGACGICAHAAIHLLWAQGK